MKRYRKLFLKGAVFIVIFVLIDFLLGMLLERLEGLALEKNPSEMQVDYTIYKVNSDVVIMGASEAAHSYIPSILRDSLGCSVYNCGNDGKPTYYQIAMVNCILDRYTPKMIIWSVGPMFFSDKNENADLNRLSVLNRFYKKNQHCKEVINKKSRYEGVKCSLNCYGQNSNLYTYLSCIIKPDQDTQYGRYIPLYGTDKNMELQERNYNEVFSFQNELAEDFSKVLKRCGENGVNLVLVFTPRYEKSDYYNQVSYTKLKDIANEHSVTLIEDFYRDPRIYQPQFFKDCAHLNDDGAVLFTELLSEKLKSVITQ